MQKNKLKMYVKIRYQLDDKWAYTLFSEILSFVCGLWDLFLFRHNVLI